ncbi:MAG: tRNA pseudouridine(55) synthase TruB [Myxococcota bacterium]|nr:tRNA pseudouridine(55) synthase TruB [Myxococcota bacterium]
MDGVFLIDKPVGVTSFDVVRAVRRAANERKVGHAGTLDPLASGLLVVAMGQGTKLIPYLMAGTKRYVATISLGAETDTDDAEGKVIRRAPVPQIRGDVLGDVLLAFTGSIEQVPPRYSALKCNGEPLYRKARRGETVTPKARQVTIHSIDVISHGSEEIVLDVQCGKGTYIRSLARDLAQQLETAGHLSGLRRIASSGFCVEAAVALDRLKQSSRSEIITNHALSLAEAVPLLPKVLVDAQAETRLCTGQAVPIDDISGPVHKDEDSHVGILNPEGHLFAVGLIDQQWIRPVRIIVPKS